MNRRQKTTCLLLGAASVLAALCLLPVHVPVGDDFRTPSSREADRKQSLDMGRVLRQELPARGRRIEVVEVQVAGGARTTRLQIQLASKAAGSWKTVRQRTARVKARRARQVIRVAFRRPIKIKLGDQLAITLRATEALPAPPSAWVNTEFLRAELALFANGAPIAGTLQLTVHYEPLRGPLALLAPRVIKQTTVLMTPRERAAFGLAWLAIGIGVAWLMVDTYRNPDKGAPRPNP
jgi:hypothetical protein